MPVAGANAHHRLCLAGARWWHLGSSSSSSEMNEHWHLPWLRSCFSLEEIIMPNRFSGLMTTIAIAVASAVISVPIPSTQAQVPATEQGLKTTWGEPDLQGIWTAQARHIYPPPTVNRAAFHRPSHPHSGGFWRRGVGSSWPSGLPAKLRSTISHAISAERTSASTISVRTDHPAEAHFSSDVGRRHLPVRVLSC
jgi:hypothetical protein